LLPGGSGSDPIVGRADVFADKRRRASAMLAIPDAARLRDVSMGWSFVRISRSPTGRRTGDEVRR
jgi:hypothetical protein